MRPVLNVVWSVLAGFWMAMGSVLAGVAPCLTIIGIPLGIDSFEMVPISLLPLGRAIAAPDRVLAAR